ncbi:MAG: DUF1127 domain-containing protein [Geminicoccaceae bacterium]
MKNQNCIDTIIPSTAPARFKLPPWVGTVLSRVHGWVERSRQRRQLAQLNEYALRDIGLTSADVRTEVEKPFWQP